MKNALAALMSTLVFLGAIAWLSSFSTPPAIDGGLSECSGSAAIGECDDPDPDNLECDGFCPTETECKKGTFSSGSTTYYSCACGPTGGGSGTQPSCCHLVVIPDGAAGWKWMARGNCPSCNTTGACKIAESCQAVCE